MIFARPLKRVLDKIIPFNKTETIHALTMAETFMSLNFIAITPHSRFLTSDTLFKQFSQLIMFQGQAKLTELPSYIAPCNSLTATSRISK